MQSLESQLSSLGHWGVPKWATILYVALLEQPLSQMLALGCRPLCGGGLYHPCALTRREMQGTEWLWMPSIPWSILVFINQSASGSPFKL